MSIKCDFYVAFYTRFYRTPLQTSQFFYFFTHFAKNSCPLSIIGFGHYCVSYSVFRYHIVISAWGDFTLLIFYEKLGHKDMSCELLYLFVCFVKGCLPFASARAAVNCISCIVNNKNILFGCFDNQKYFLNVK